MFALLSSLSSLLQELEIFRLLVFTIVVLLLILNLGLLWSLHPSHERQSLAAVIFPQTDTRRKRGHID
jgi:cytochrome c oxidase subunit IV